MCSSSLTLLTLLTVVPNAVCRSMSRYRGWTFIDAANHSNSYQTLLAKGAYASLVAVEHREGSTRTAGYILLQLIFGILTWEVRPPAQRSDQRSVAVAVDTISIEGRPVSVRHNCKLFQDGRHWHRWPSPSSKAASRAISWPDYYIAALRRLMSGLVTDQMKALAPRLRNLGSLRTAWMNGIQFLSQAGCSARPTVIPSMQTRPGRSLPSHKDSSGSRKPGELWDGQVGGLLSADIPIEETPSILYGKPAMAMLARRRLRRSLAQIKAT